MIIGKLNQTDQVKYLSYIKDLKFAFDFLKSVNFRELPLGRVEICGKRFFGYHSEFQTKPLNEAIWEGHKKYIDLQFVIEGREWLGITDISNMQITQDYNNETDAVLGLSDSKEGFELNEGMFAVLFPDEAHAPGIFRDTPQNVHKIVLKIPLEI